MSADGWRERQRDREGDREGRDEQSVSCDEDGGVVIRGPKSPGKRGGVCVWISVLV